MEPLCQVSEWLWKPDWFRKWSASRLYAVHDLIDIVIEDLFSTSDMVFSDDKSIEPATATCVRHFAHVHFGACSIAIIVSSAFITCHPYRICAAS